MKIELESKRFPIYTGETECRDCYKCIRTCPVKAIHMENSKASIIDERCILCGQCVRTCPPGAKHVRSDIDRVKGLLDLKEKVFVSLAPSWVSEFENLIPSQLITALEDLGFYGVSETALGAQEVSAHVARIVEKKGNRVSISSACPATVELIRKYYPQYCGNITELPSPALAHAKLLRKKFGEEIGVVFIGPCIAKKYESDNHPDLIDAAMTFMELSQWLREKGIRPDRLRPRKSAVFIPEPAGEGALYPVEGGMIAGIRANCPVNDRSLTSVSGIDEIQSALDCLDRFNTKEPVFLEMLACRGGCINGTGCGQNHATLLKRHKVLESTAYCENRVPGTPELSLENRYSARPVEKRSHEEAAIRVALEGVGKYAGSDELNCGGCGYDSCLEFGEALLDGKAEKNMCVTHLRQLSQKKTNALLNSMPSGVVIVDSGLNVVECNRKFAALAGRDAEMAFEARPGMEGAHLKRIVPFTDYFERVLRTGEDLLDINIRYKKTILHASIFTIEERRIVGGIFLDITEPAMHKEQIIRRTRKVIEKNLATVQKIAYLLGENASETEVILDSIIRSFSPDSEAGE